jgi:hypothetical protein
MVFLPSVHDCSPLIVSHPEVVVNEYWDSWNYRLEEHYIDLHCPHHQNLSHIRMGHRLKNHSDVDLQQEVVQRVEE